MQDEKPPTQTTPEDTTDQERAEIAITVGWMGTDHYHRDKLLGAIIAALSDVRGRERGRCASIVRRRILDEHATVMLQEIENGG